MDEIQFLLVRVQSHAVSQPVFKNLMEGGKPDLSDSVGFWKIRENLAEMHRRRWRNSKNQEYWKFGRFHR
jgi:hypothetical protein